MRSGSLDIGVFALQEMLDILGAEKIIDDLKESLRDFSMLDNPSHD